MKREEDRGIASIREVRHKISAEFDNHPKKLGDHLRELEKNTPTVSCETSKRSRMRSRRQNNRGMMLTTEAMIADASEEKGDSGMGGGGMGMGM